MSIQMNMCSIAHVCLQTITSSHRCSAYHVTLMVALDTRKWRRCRLLLRRRLGEHCVKAVRGSIDARDLAEGPTGYSVMAAQLFERSGRDANGLQKKRECFAGSLRVWWLSDCWVNL